MLKQLSFEAEPKKKEPLAKLSLFAKTFFFSSMVTQQDAARQITLKALALIEPSTRQDLIDQDNVKILIDDVLADE